MALPGRDTRQSEDRAEAYGRWLRQRNPCAIGSMVLAVFNLIEMGVTIIFGLGGIVLGIIALRQLKQPAHSDQRGRNLAWGGIIVSVIGLTIGAVLYLIPVFTKS
jgi:hypothetical protein